MVAVGGFKALTYCNDYLACRFDTTGDDRVVFFVEVNRHHLAASHIAAADFTIQHESRVVEITSHKLRDLDNVCRFHHALEQVVPQDLLNEPRVDGRLVDAEDTATLDDGRKGIIARCEERDVLLRGEEFGGVLDLTEQSYERRERFLARKYCCEILRRSEGGSGCCEERVVGTHYSGGEK